MSETRSGDMPEGKKQPEDGVVEALEEAAVITTDDGTEAPVTNTESNEPVSAPVATTAANDTLGDMARALSSAGGDDKPEGPQSEYQASRGGRPIPEGGELEAQATGTSGTDDDRGVLDLLRKANKDRGKD